MSDDRSTSQLLMAPLLGAVGLASAGPLVSTLLIGRTGVMPSLRWAGVSLAVWVTLGTLAWAGVRGRPYAALSALAPLAALSIFLPWAYLDDRVSHAIARGATLLLTSLGALAVLGLAWQSVVLSRSGSSTTSLRSRDAPAELSPALVAAIAGMTLMYGLNDVIFEPLGQAGASPLAPLHNLWVLAPALIAALAVRAQLLHPFHVASLTATFAVSAALAVRLGLAPPGPATFGVAAIALVPAGQDLFWQNVPAPARKLAIAALAIGFALGATQLNKYGLAARELMTVTPTVASAMPALGLLPVAAVLAFAAAVGPRLDLTQRRDGRDA